MVPGWVFEFAWISGVVQVVVGTSDGRIPTVVKLVQQTRCGIMIKIYKESRCAGSPRPEGWRSLQFEMWYIEV